MRFVNRSEARKGTCIDTYAKKSECLAAGTRMEKVLKKQLKPAGELVYCFIPGEHGTLVGSTWQIYLLLAKAGK
jgi:hypothetical protein